MEGRFKSSEKTKQLEEAIACDITEAACFPFADFAKTTYW
jgi:hypothetical protein